MVIIATLGISKLIVFQSIPRYDCVLLICIIMQCIMVAVKLETIDELKVICAFHILGLCLEIYKVHMGSWCYPEFSYLKIMSVPIYSGFMYASVASYICQAWKRFDLRFDSWPSIHFTFGIAIIIYLNFFSHHFITDLRWVLYVLLVFIFRKTKVHFEVNTHTLHMPVLFSFFLIGFFIWIAENISTFLGAWRYPNQAKSWNLVHTGKISSWFLLVIISIILVVDLKRLKYRDVSKV